MNIHVLKYIKIIYYSRVSTRNYKLYDNKNKYSQEKQWIKYKKSNKNS
jgi:hypothetical protein